MGKRMTLKSPPRPTTSTDSRMRIWAEVSASLLIILVIHIERSTRSVPITTRTTRDSSSSLGPMAVVRPEKKRESGTTGLSSPSEVPAIANWPTGRSAAPASSRMGTIKPSDVARRMIPTSSGLSTRPAACRTIPTARASSTLRPSASPAKRARGPRKRVRGRVRRLAILGRLAMGAAEAPVVDRDDGVVRGQQRHDVAPVGHGLRHAVQQEHRLACVAPVSDGVHLAIRWSRHERTGTCVLTGAAGRLDTLLSEFSAQSETPSSGADGNAIMPWYVKAAQLRTWRRLRTAARPTSCGDRSSGMALS
jgi:hypothetical protein